MPDFKEYSMLLTSLKNPEVSYFFFLKMTGTQKNA